MSSSGLRNSRSSNNSETGRPRSAPRGLGEVLGSSGWNEFQANVYDSSHIEKSSKKHVQLVDVVTERVAERTGRGDDSDGESDEEKQPGCFTRNCPTLANRRRVVDEMLRTESSSWPAIIYQGAHLGVLIVGAFIISHSRCYGSWPE
jgi:hypothetical protein